MYTRRIPAFALMAMFAAACTSDGTGPTDEENQIITEDVAMVAADAALDDVAQMVVPSFTPELNLSASGPITVSRTITFYDGEGNPMDRYDAELTASINMLVEMSQETLRDAWTASVERSRDLTVSGLLGQETTRIWNGEGTGSVTGSRHVDTGGTRNYDMSSVVLIDNVVVGIPRSDNPWPLSGTITRTITVTVTQGDRTQTHTRTAVLEFNGTQFATLTIGDEVFEIDLAARDSDRPHRKHDR